ncbi:MAG: AI-2E family transporter [Chloroflexota bacterium]
MNSESPQWPQGFKRVALYATLAAIAFFAFQIRFLILPLLMSMVLAYVVLPFVNLLHSRLRLPRVLAISIIYLLLLTALVAIPTFVSTPLVRQINNLSSDIPAYIESAEAVLDQPYILPIPNSEPFTIREQLRLEQLEGGNFEDLLTRIAPFGLQGFSVFGNVASYTALTLGWIVFAIFVSFYMVKDYEIFLNWLIGLVPEEYEWEAYQLAYELSSVWNAFLRGQIILFFIMGIIVFALASIIGLPNALFLGLIAAFAEFIPQFGPMIVTIPAVLIAYVQHDQSWLGSQMSPLWFAFVIALGYFMLNQLSGYFIAPRVLGRTLNMHPLIVFLGALGGAVVAGILGILLASPLLASGRVIFRYIYCKIRDIPPYPTVGNPTIIEHVSQPAPDPNSAPTVNQTSIGGILNSDISQSGSD